MRVVAAVIMDDGKVLACRRNASHELAGKWEFPGGKVELGETDQIALAREVEEELGVRIVVGDFIIESSMPRGLGRTEMFTYFAHLVGPRPVKSSDHDLMEWVAIEQLHSFNWADLDVPVVNALQRPIQ